jgi:site-specific DNA-methyltransferase (adenine-specific)
MKPYYDDGAGRVIYCADCRDVLPLLEKADLCLTDPPYNIKHVDGGGFASATSFYRDGALSGLTDFNLSIYSSVFSNCANQIVAFHSRDQIEDYARFLRESFGTYDLHFWHKVNAIPFTHNVWKSDIEYIALGWRSKNHAPVEQHIKSKMYSSGLEVGKLHPTQKPIALMKKYLRVLNPKSVIDPFMGSGTTLRACKDLGLACTGIELEEKYCEIAARRLQQEVFEFN